MIWYAFETLLFLALLSIAFFVYRALVNSAAFTRFIERTKGTSEVGDMNIRIHVAEEQTEEARETAKDQARRIMKEIRAAKRRRGS